MVVHSSPLQFSFTFYLFFTPSLPSQFSWRPGGTLRWHSISGWIPTVSFCAFRRIKNTFRCKKFVLIIMSVENVLSQNYTTLFPVRGHWMLVKCGGWLKMLDMKMTDHQNCRAWNCRTWDCRHENAGMKMQDMKMTDQNWRQGAKF